MVGPEDRRAGEAAPGAGVIFLGDFLPRAGNENVSPGDDVDKIFAKRGEAGFGGQAGVVIGQRNLTSVSAPGTTGNLPSNWPPCLIRSISIRDLPGGTRISPAVSLTPMRVGDSSPGFCTNTS